MRPFRKLEKVPSRAEESFTARIQALRADLEAYINRIAEAEAQKCPGVPEVVIRNLVTRNSGCACGVVLRLERSEVDR